MERLLAGILWGVLSLWIAGCGGSTDEPPRRDPPAAAGPAAAAAAGSNRLAFKLYRELRNRPGNLVFAPSSVASVLGMTAAGAAGGTQEEILTALAAPGVSLAEVLAGQGELTRWLSGTRSGGVRLDNANRLWVQERYPLKAEFLSANQEAFGAEVGIVDFGQTEEARKRLNAWGANATQDRIKEAIPEGVLNHLTRVVLMNAIYFKGPWKDAFDPKMTRDQPFFVDGKEARETPTMWRTEERYEYHRDQEARVLRVPYRGDELSMVLVLPEARDGLGALESSLDEVQLAAWIKQLMMIELPVGLPKFKFESAMSLVGALSKAGAGQMFDPEKADFRNMNGAAPGDSEALYIAAALQAAMIEVNEEGTEAAAVTSFAAKKSAEMNDPPRFIADHPFMFFVMDDATGTIVFMGRVVDPGAGGGD